MAPQSSRDAGARRLAVVVAAVTVAGLFGATAYADTPDADAPDGSAEPTQSRASGDHQVPGRVRIGLINEVRRELGAMRSSRYQHDTDVDERTGRFDYDCSGLLDYACSGCTRRLTRRCR